MNNIKGAFLAPDQIEQRLPTQGEAQCAASLLLRCNGYDLDVWSDGEWPVDDAFLRAIASQPLPSKGDGVSEQPEVIWARLDNATLYADGSSPCVARTKEFANGTKYVRADASSQAEIERLRTNGREFIEAAEAVFDWMNGNDLSADHEEQHPDDFERVSKALVAFRAALAEGKE